MWDEWHWSFVSSPMLCWETLAPSSIWIFDMYHPHKHCWRPNTHTLFLCMFTFYLFLRTPESLGFQWSSMSAWHKQTKHPQSSINVRKIRHTNEIRQKVADLHKSGNGKKKKKISITREKAQVSKTTFRHHLYVTYAHAQGFTTPASAQWHDATCRAPEQKQLFHPSFCLGILLFPDYLKSLFTHCHHLNPS